MGIPDSWRNPKTIENAFIRYGHIRSISVNDKQEPITAKVEFFMPELIFLLRLPFLLSLTTIYCRRISVLCSILLLTTVFPVCIITSSLKQEATKASMDTEELSGMEIDLTILSFYPRSLVCSKLPGSCSYLRHPPSFLSST
ncbi:hypothetical protein J6590_071831 [Homalodisca vitripennis]|nr:hypothetical protein J6590_071831 [Homalodisca vitripennis]